MKERGGMPYDVVAYEADELAMLLTPEQEGLFHRLLRRAWMNGSIPDDVDKLAGICRITKLQMRRCWPMIQPLWEKSTTEPGRLFSSKQEREREWKGRYSAVQATSGRLGGLAKSRHLKDSDVANAKQTTSNSLASHPFPSPSLPIPLLIDSSLPENISTKNASASLPLPIPLLSLGEFGCAKMTEEEHRKLEAKLNGSLAGYIEDFDRWVHESPKAKTSSGKREDRHAYETISAWYSRDKKKENNGYKTKAQRIDETSRRLLHQLDQQNSGGGGSGDHGLYGTGLPRAPEKTRR